MLIKNFNFLSVISSLLFFLIPYFLEIYTEIFIGKTLQCLGLTSKLPGGCTDSIKDRRQTGCKLVTVEVE